MLCLHPVLLSRRGGFFYRLPMRWLGCKGSCRTSLPFHPTLNIPTKVILEEPLPICDGDWVWSLVNRKSFTYPLTGWPSLGSKRAGINAKGGLLWVVLDTGGLQLRRIPATLHAGIQPDRRVNVSCPFVYFGEEQIGRPPSTLSPQSPSQDHIFVASHALSLWSMASTIIDHSYY
jgi:hypothetical protein